MFHDIYADFQCTVLPNGLTIYTKEWPHANWFYGGIVVHVGAREDPKKREGLAHFVEHVISENVNGLQYSQITDRFKQLGGIGWFGRTGYLASKYRFHFPDEPDSIHQAFDLFGQMLLEGHLTHNIEAEKEVISREYHRRYEHQMARAWALQGRPWLFEHHPRLRSYDAAIGILEEFRQCTAEELQIFYDTFYTPQNMSIVCIGAITEKRVLHIIQDTPFYVQRSGQRNGIPFPFSPQIPQRHGQIIHMSEFSQLVPTQASLTWEWVLPLHFARNCVRILCSMLKNLLTRELRYESSLHLTYDVSIAYTYYQDCRTFRIHVAIPPEVVETVKDLLWQVLRSIHQAQAQFLAVKKERIDCILRMDYSGKDLLQSVIADLEEYHHLVSFSDLLQQLEQTSFDDVVELASYLTPERHFCFVVLP